MQIEKIYYINLNRSQERNRVFRENMQKIEIDMSIVHRNPGHDVRDYKNFNDFKTDIQSSQPDWNPVLKSFGNLGFLWSIREILKLIIETQCISMMLWDDVMLKRPLNDFNRLLSFIPPKDFKCLQVYYCEPDPQGFYPIDIHAKTQKKFHKEIWKNFRGAGDNCNVFSPAGAHLYLQVMNQYPNGSLEGLVGKFLMHQHHSGIYAVVEKDKYVGTRPYESDRLRVNEEAERISNRHSERENFI